MSKHTPGNWKFARSIPEEGYECFWIESDDEFMNAIADVRGPQNEENTANARLISAAPDLLEALIAVMRSKDRRGIDLAVAAISKAIGEKP